MYVGASPSPIALKQGVGRGGGGVRTDCGVCDKEVEINLDFFYFERDRQKGNISQSSKNHCNH